MQENFERYKRELDRVRVTEDGKRALAERLSRRKTQTVRCPRRMMAGRIAAVAAVVCLLAGTAVAAYMSRVAVAPYEDGYYVRAESRNIPLTSLPEDILERAAASDGSTDLLPFDSWDEAETYLGLEIADNTRLDQMEKGLLGESLNESEPIEAPAFIHLHYYEERPDFIDLKASYMEGGLGVDVEAVLMVEVPTSDKDRTYGFRNTGAKMLGRETYVTPSGIEATIITSHADYAEGLVFTEYAAQFYLGHAYFCVETRVHESESGEEAIALLKEILDAYE